MKSTHDENTAAGARAERASALRHTLDEICGAGGVLVHVSGVAYVVPDAVAAALGQ